MTRRSIGPDSDEASSESRGVSDLIGFVLIFSLIAAVVGIVSLAGLTSLEGARDAQQTNNAERAMEVLSDNMGDLTDRGAPSRATEVSLSDASMYMGDETTLTVNDTQETLLPGRVFKLRPIVYEDENAKLVYVNGAVFRVERDGGVVLRSWDSILDEDRTMIPIINTASATGGPQSIKSDTVLVRSDAYQRLVPVSDESSTYDDVWINVTSARSDLWERMLEADGNLDCQDDGPDSIACELTLGSGPDRLYVVETRVSIALKP